jgi:DNA polymerase I-like protein with 3'-5' exonuclease and polymerase domains
MIHLMTDKTRTGDALPWFLGKDSHLAYTAKVPYLVLDWETTNLEFGNPINPDNNLVLGCWLIVYPDGTIQRKHKFGDEYDYQELLDDIAYVAGEKGFIVAHNAKFELQWLRRCGLDLRSTLAYCTQLGQWVLDGNTGLGQRSLDSVARRYGLGAKDDLVKRLIDAGVCPSKIRRDWLLRYCGQDVDLCHAVFLIQVAQLAKREQLHLAHVRNLTCSVLADIEFEGMALDPVAVREEYEKTFAEWSEAQAKLYEITGGINLGSPKQLGEFLFGELGFAVPLDFRKKPMLTGTGAVSTNAQALARLVPKSDEQREFLRIYGRFNKLDSLLTKNLIFFKRVCEEFGCKFYGSFNQGVTATHRLSSSGRPLLFEGEKKTKGAQLQNLPRMYKGLFWSGDEDWLIGEADGAQLEFRVAADLGHDAVAFDMIANQGDVHTDTAKVYVDWNATHPKEQHPDFIDKDYKSGRQPAKSQTFKPLYGGMGSHPAEVEYCQFFKNKYQGIAATQTGWTYEVLNNKQLRTPYGMIFYWPDTSMSRGGYISNTTSIYNYPVQGFATGEIIPIALVHFWHRTAGMRIRIFTTIHDSIGSKVHKDEVEAYKEISKVSLTTDVYRFLREVYGYEFSVPLGVGVKVARNWAQTKTEEAWNVWPDGKETYTIKE